MLWEFKVGRGKDREKAKKPGRGEFIKKPQDNSSWGKICVLNFPSSYRGNYFTSLGIITVCRRSSWEEVPYLTQENGLKKSGICSVREVATPSAW